MIRFLFLLIGIFWISSTGYAMGDDIKYKTLGLRYGISNINEKDVRSLELDANIGLPLTYKLYDNLGLYLKPKLNFSAGGLKQDDDFGYLLTFSGGLALFAYDKKIILDLLGGGALLTEEKVGGHNFGGNFQFAGHGGMVYKITDHVLMGYRFYHLSDAGIFDGNGLNRHLVELSYYF